MSESTQFLFPPFSTHAGRKSPRPTLPPSETTEHPEHPEMPDNLSITDPVILIPRPREKDPSVLLAFDSPWILRPAQNDVARLGFPSVCSVYSVVNSLSA
jgi:hypothetical protein